MPEPSGKILTEEQIKALIAAKMMLDDLGYEECADILGHVILGELPEEEG